MTSPITLTTDYGTRDAYVAAMKGVIAGIAPNVAVHDVTHEIEAQDVMGAGWALRQAVPFFPPQTIHLAVVDPGVGTDRRAIACRIGEHLFVGPDNGLFSLLLGEDVLGPNAPDEIVELDRAEFWRDGPTSTTFHGRDIFAAVAAHLANGARPSDVGTPIPPDSLVKLQWVKPRVDDEGVQGWVVHVDGYGNAITNIRPEIIEMHGRGRHVRFYAGSATVNGIADTYAAVEPGEALVVVGSSGFLEIGVNTGDAAGLFSLIRGSAVNAVFGERR